MCNLLVATHIDDETFNCSGFLQRNPDTYIIVICKGRDEANSEKRISVLKELYNDRICVICDYNDLTLNVTDIAKICYKIEWILCDLQPSTVIIPSEQDLHQDHIIVSRAAKIACRYKKCDSSVKEVLEATTNVHPWNCVNADTLIELTDTELALKQQFSNKYVTENVPKSGQFEYYKTYYRVL